MAIYQEKRKNKITKDGRSWFFRVPYVDISGKRIQHMSGKYYTKKEAQVAEREFLASIKDKTDNTNMKFKDLYLAFYDYQKDKVKETTFQTYYDRVPFLESLDNIKLEDFNINHYEMWKKNINSKNLATSTKNDILKFLKAILNYGSKYYNFNFSSVYNKMTNFTNPNEMPKEMEFYTYDEFKQFIKYETDLKYKCLFETLYYCGLRNGEMRGITWDDIDFNKQTIRVNKQIPTRFTSKSWKFTSPKTKSSIRTLPLAETLYNDLKELYNKVSQHSNFKSTWFVFGEADIPIVADNPNDRQRIICKKAKVKKIRIHDFRHSCASLLINNGANVAMVAKYLGHTKVEETLNTYTHLFDSELNSIINIINKLDKIDSKEVIDTIADLCDSGISKDDILNHLKNIKN
jgi:integrase